jgi:signal peptidase I
MGLRRFIVRVIFILSLVPSFNGCDAARWILYAPTHRTIKVATEGMLPTAKPGDLATVDESYYSKHPMQRFDMVTFKLAQENIPHDLPGLDTHTVYLQRVIGLGGEVLEIKRGRIYIDGLELEEPFATVQLEGREKFGPITIPDGECFLMGDNRRNSWDSRYWASPTLKKPYIIGKVIEIFPQQQ